MEIKRGQIWWVCLDDSVGGEQQTGRPGLIVSGNSSNEREATVIIAFMTSGGIPSPHNVTVSQNGLRQRVLCRQLRTVDKSRLTKCVGEVTPEELSRVTGALATSLCVPLAKPTVNTASHEDAEKIALRVERDLYKQLYERALEKLVTMRFEMDTEPQVVEEPELDFEEEIEMAEPEVVETPTPVVEEPEPVIEKPVVVEKPVFTGKVNINTATAREMMEVLGLSKDDACALTGYRKKNGNFVCLEEVCDVRRWSANKLAKYAEHLTIGDDEEPVSEVVAEIPAPVMPVEPESQPVEKVSVSTASMYELMTAGFSKTAAAKILHYRKQVRPFRTLDDLLEVDGVTPRILRKLRDKLEV